MINRIRRGDGRDDGAALLLALFFIVLVGILVAALLPYTQSGISEASTARDVRSTQNALDGAMKGAIEQIRPSLSQGTNAVPCPTYTAPTYTPDVGSAVDVTVTCAQTSSGISISPDVPPYAIVTTQQGITLSGDRLSIDGGVYSSGDIAINPPTSTGPNGPKYIVTGDVFVRNGGTCSQVTASGANCPAAANTPAFPSISYDSGLGGTSASATSAIGTLTADQLGSCPAGKSYVEFQPGYYSQIPQPDPSDTNCNGRSLYWFAPCVGATPGSTCSGTTPGTYYFDFADASYTNYTNEALWDLNANNDFHTSNISIIGGSLKSNWDTLTAGHRCDSKKLGVQFVFGGPTQLTSGGGEDVEICASATSATSRQRIALYGLSNNASYGFASPAGPRTAASSEVAAANTATDPDADTGWTNPDGARVIGDTTGLPLVPNVATTTSFDGTAANKTVGVLLRNYPSVSDGSLITGASIHIKHYETTTNSATITPKVKITYSDGTSDTCTGSASANLPVLVDTTIDLFGSSCSHTLLNADPTQAQYRWRLLKGATVAYEAVGAKHGSDNPSGTAAVDGVQLVTTSVAPALEAERCQSGQATCYSYSNSFSDANANAFFIGSVYTPTVPLHVVVHNNPETIFQRGVIAAYLEVEANSSSKQTDSPFQLPHSAATSRTVLFRATTSGRELLRARVQYIDCTPATTCQTANADSDQVFPGKQVNILEWTTLH